MITIIPNWHPFFVHFTVALLLSAVAMYFFAFVYRHKDWHGQLLQAGKWNYWVGTAAALVTAIAGWFAYNSVAHDAPSHAAMTVHRNWALVTLLVILLTAVYLYWSARLKRQWSGLLLGGMLSVAVLVATTAWHGGELVYRFGLGVMSMPISEGDGHAHEHGDAGHHGAEDALAPTSMHHADNIMPSHPETDVKDHHAATSAVEENTKKVQAVPKGHEHHDHAH